MSPSRPCPPPSGSVGLYRQMLRIRKLQLAIEAHYHEDRMKTPVHLYIGQEAIAVGVCAHLRARDKISSNHRSHGHYLAKGGDMKALVAELFCKATGCSRGYGGSMHVVDASVGHLGSSSIVGGGIPLAVGMAFASRYRRDDGVAVAFFGDGAADEGVLYESVNFAMLKSLPVVFVCENNQYSVCSPVAARHAGDLVFHSLPQSRLFSRKLDGNSLPAVHDAAGEAVARARAGDGPSFLECATYRMRGHAGAGSDAHLGYRSAEEIAEWAAKDPLDRTRAALLAAGETDEEELRRMGEEIDAEIAEAFRFGEESPLPPAGEMEKFLYREEGA